ncbi:calmodulin-like [Hippocampus zosterae]|uniref:calmodulin-like n=1 Tax=Hippocampus zosterae TaxID=109293 RepID=UPI00223DBAD1|nr:calmodulin-like [Hippocampus zosterae]
MKGFLQEVRVYDDDADGFILTPQLGKLVRSARLFPSEDNIEELKKRVDRGGRFCQEDFITATLDFHERQKHINHEQEMMKAFAFFDEEECGTIPLEELKKIMESFSEPLSNEEAEEIMRLARKSGDGKLHYREFVKMILSGKVD